MKSYLVFTMHAYQFQSSIQSDRRSTGSFDDGVSAFSSPTILVVDDEPQIVELLTTLLEDEGYRVCSACNGQDALGVIRNDVPELIISDVMMPAVNGLELLRHIENTVHDPSPKMILMSALDKPSLMQGVAFLQKPFDVDDLLDMIDGALADGDRKSH